MTFSSVSEPVARLHLDVDADLAPAAPAGARRHEDPQVVDAGAQPLAADVDLGVAVVHRLDDALEPEPANRDPVADGRRRRGISGRRGGGWRRRGSSAAVDRRRWPIASSAARASARAAPVSPVGIAAAARRALGVGRHRVGARLQRRRRRRRSPRRASRSRSSMRSSSRCRNVSSRSRSSCSRACSFVASSPSAVALARDEPALVLERLQVALDLRQVLGQLRLARAAVLPRAASMIDAGQAEPVGDLERQAAARRAVDAAGRSARTSPGRSRTRRGVTPSVVDAYVFSAS